MSFSPADPDNVPCDKFDPHYPWDPIIPSDEEMEADAKMEQDMIRVEKPREGLVKVQGKKCMPLLAPKGEIAKLLAVPGPEAPLMKLAAVVDPGGKRPISSDTKRLPTSTLESRSIAEDQGRDKYTLSPAWAPGSGSVPMPSMPERVPPLLVRPLGASAVASPAHIPPPISTPFPPGKLEDTAPQTTAQIPLLAKLLFEGQRPADSTSVPALRGEYKSIAGTPNIRTPQPVALTTFPAIRRPGDVSNPTYTPLTGLTPQLLPNPTHGQAAAPTLSSSGPPLGQTDKRAYASNEEGEHRNRELNLLGRHSPESADVAKEVGHALKGRPHSQAAVTGPFRLEDPHRHRYLPPMAGSGSHSRVSELKPAGGSPRLAYNNTRVIKPRSKYGASGSIPYSNAQQHKSYSLREANLSRNSSVRYRGELRAEYSPNLPRIPSELRRQQWDSRAQGRVRVRRDIPPRERSASPASLPTTPRSWNPGGEPNSLRVVYPHYHYPSRNTQETPSKAAPVGPTASGDSQFAGTGAPNSGTRIGRDRWGYPTISPAPTAAHHAQPPSNTVRSTSGSLYSPPPRISATPSTRSTASDRRPRMPSETPSYEPPETFARSDRSSPSYHPPSEDYAHTSPSPPPQPSGQRQTNHQSMQPPSRPSVSESTRTRSSPAPDLSGVRVRGISYEVEARAQAQAQARAQAEVREQALNYRGPEQWIGGAADNAVAGLAVSGARARPRWGASASFIKGRAPRYPRTRWR